MPPKPLSIWFDPGSHNLSVPPGLDKLLLELFKAAGLEGKVQVYFGKIIPPLPRGTWKIVREGLNSVMVKANPVTGKSETARRCYVVPQGGMKSKQLYDKLKAGERKLKQQHVAAKLQAKHLRDERRAERQARPKPQADAARASQQRQSPPVPVQQADAVAAAQVSPPRTQYRTPASERLSEFAQRKGRRRRSRMWNILPKPGTVTGPKEVQMPRPKKDKAPRKPPEVTIKELVADKELWRKVRAVLKGVIDDKSQFVSNEALRLKLPALLRERGFQVVGKYFLAVSKSRRLRQVAKGQYELPDFADGVERSTVSQPAVEPTGAASLPRSTLLQKQAASLNRHTPIEVLIDLTVTLTPQKIQELQEIEELERPHKTALAELEARREAVKVGVPEEAFLARVILLELQAERHAEHQRQRVQLDLMDRVLRGEVSPVSPLVIAEGPVAAPTEAAVRVPTLPLAVDEIALAFSGGASTEASLSESSQPADEHGPTPAVWDPFAGMESEEATPALVAEPEATASPETAEPPPSDGTQGE